MPNIKRKFGLDFSFQEYFQDSEAKPIIFTHFSFMGTAIDENGITKLLIKFSRQLKPLIKDFFEDLKKNTD
ncbi:MAG: hypothetical protein ACFFDN_00475 [Candidatus Hodarchaeota archaeon]